MTIITDVIIIIVEIELRTHSLDQGRQFQLYSTDELDTKHYVQRSSNGPIALVLQTQFNKKWRVSE